MYLTYTYNPSLNIYCLFFYFVTMNSFNAEFRNFGILISGILDFGILNAGILNFGIPAFGF